MEGHACNRIIPTLPILWMSMVGVDRLAMLSPSRLLD